MCETNDPIHFKEKIEEKYLNLDEIKRRIDKREDIIGRKDQFIKVDLDNSFPEFLLNNKSNYKEWIES